MKWASVSRKIDELGRIVIPMEIRNNMNIKEKDDFFIYVEDDKIILEKTKNCCIYCRNKNNLKIFSEMLICNNCINKIKKL